MNVAHRTRQWLASLFAVVMISGCSLASSGPIYGDSPPQSASAELIDPRRIVSDPIGYKGANVLLVGEVSHVEQYDSNTFLNLYADVRATGGREMLIVRVYPPVRSILPDDCWWFAGVVAGTSKTTRALTGAEQQSPTVHAYRANKVDCK